jgi:AcrR family transcriptional regulator
MTDKTDKKSRIIDVAVELFSRNGFEGTSMRDLATAAGVNIAMINYYFGTKEKLFEAIVASGSNLFRGMMEELLEDKNLSAMQRLEKIVEYHIGKTLGNRHFYKVLHSEVLLNKRPELNEAIGNLFKRNTAVISAIIEDGCKAGEFKKVDIPLTVASLFGTINHVFLSRTMANLIFTDSTGGDPFSDEKNKKRLVTFMRQLLRAHLLK